MLAEQVRAGLAWRRSDANRVPLNAAGSALLDQRVIDKQKEWLDLEQQKGGYEAVEHYQPLHTVYSNIAQFINCSESEVALVESATVAWQRVFYGFELSPEHVVLMSSVEYGSNAIALLQQQRRQGFQIRLIPEYSSGEVNIEALNDLLSHVHNVALVSLTHIPTSSGIVQPAATVGSVCRKHSVPYLVDGTQAVGQLPIDVHSLNADFLCATGRKYLRAPRGTGFLYARANAMGAYAHLCPEPATLDNFGAEWVSDAAYAKHSSARRFETFESNVAAHVGLGQAVSLASSFGQKDMYDRIHYLAARMRSALRESHSFVRVHDAGSELCGIVSFSIDGLDSHHVRTRLKDNGFDTTVSRRPSTRVDFKRKGVEEVNRASVHVYNLEEEIDGFAECVALIASARECG